MRVVIGDCQFEAVGDDPALIATQYAQFLETVRKRARRVVEERIDKLKDELRAQQRILRQIDAEDDSARARSRAQQEG
jgi:hypothetical protein